jgi:hypothetical protein
MAEKDGQEWIIVGSFEAAINRLTSFPGSEDNIRVITELNEQTDRGLAVLAGAYLEWKLREAIKSRLPLWDDVADQLFGTADSKGALTLGLQAKIAHCLGLIGPICQRDIEDIAEVRNRFAHRLLVSDFESEKVRAKCLGLKAITHLAPAEMISDLKLDERPRARFLFTIQFLGLSITAAAAYYLKHTDWSDISGPTKFSTC